MGAKQISINGLEPGDGADDGGRGVNHEVECNERGHLKNMCATRGCNVSLSGHIFQYVIYNWFSTKYRCTH